MALHLNDIFPVCGNAGASSQPPTLIQEERTGSSSPWGILSTRRRADIRNRELVRHQLRKGLPERGRTTGGDIKGMLAAHANHADAPSPGGVAMAQMVSSSAPCMTHPVG